MLIAQKNDAIFASFFCALVFAASDFKAVDFVFNVVN